MKERFERILTSLLVVCAGAVAVSAVKSSFYSAPAPAAARPPEFVAEWEKALPVSHPVGGRPGAPVTIVAFFDLECPACARFHDTMESFASDNPDAARFVYVHYPLSYHRNALPAARGAECAARAGAFDRWVREAFLARDSLGIKSWGSFALAAGLKDSVAHLRCMRSGRPESNIDAGLALGSEFRITGTPAVLINGWLFHETPTRAVLDSAVDRIRRGKRPAGG